MNEFERKERLREARRRLSAQRNRAGRLRGRIVAASLICFALLWGIVFVQMATGNDPVLGEKTSTASRQRSGRKATTPTRREPVEIEAEPESEFRSEAEAQTETEVQPEVEVQLEPEAELESLTTGQS